MIMSTYLKTQSLLSRVDPRLKIVVAFVWIIAAFKSDHWLVLGLFLMFVMWLFKLAGIPMLYGLKKLKSPVRVILIMFVLQMLVVPDGHVIFEMGIIQVTDVGIFHGLLVFVRLMIVLFIGMVLTATTTPTAVILSLEYFLQPFGKIGLKIGSVLLILRMIQRFVPSLWREASKVLNAQASRGLDIKGASLWMKMRLIGALLLPVFVLGIKQADQLSNAMFVRGYVMNGKKTNYRRLQRIKG